MDIPLSTPTLLAAGSALPPHYVAQEEVSALLSERWAQTHFNVNRLRQLHRAVRVEGRHLALPLAAYEELDTFAKANRAWIRSATELGERAAIDALLKADLSPRDVDRLFFVSTTGIATPSIDALLMNRIDLRADVKRTPIFGLGCAAGVAGIARAADTLRGAPDEVALLISVELCSLTMQRDDRSVANAIATGLFGDGAAAAVLGGGGRRRSGPSIVATRSIFYRDTESVMGWDLVDGGLRIMLSAAIPDLVRSRLGADVDAFLADHHVGRSDVRHWICHPGGPKVLEAMEQTLDLPRTSLARTWRTLEKVGNLSSASVLLVLAEAMEEASPGDLGLLLAMGPGFGTELALLRW